jgi:hypothetical protein
MPESESVSMVNDGFSLKATAKSWIFPYHCLVSCTVTLKTPFWVISIIESKLVVLHK